MTIVLPRKNRYSPFLKLVDAAHGLEYLHNLNFIHTDLKGVSYPDSHPIIAR
jgi:hypothetical protein